MTLSVILCLKGDTVSDEERACFKNNLSLFDRNTKQTRQLRNILQSKRAFG
ncbi:MAG: hypothetical protein IJC30_02360 [Alphaproteobacteria bacterium]|nr:hypothetical protein [Alphaproteobacteria bacterium]